MDSHTGPTALIDRTSFTPLYAQLKEILRTQIDHGVRQPGALLPSEAELCSTYEVSRTVVRQALQELEIEGRIYRRKGKGSFVAETKVHETLVQKLTGFYQDMVAQGFQVMNRVLRQEVIPAPAPIAAALEISPGTPVIVVERVRCANGEPVNLSLSHMPYARCAGILRADLTEQSLYALLENLTGHAITRGRRKIEVILPNRHVADLLELEGDVPVFVLTSVCYLDDGTPVEHALGYHRGDRSLFEVELVRGQQAASRAPYPPSFSVAEKPGG
jgi:GntR family transcriptional regulator